LILLAVLEKAEQEMYGYQIAKQLQAREFGPPMVKQSALYPVLRSLSAAELLDSHVVPSVSGPPRRYYAITSKGREALGLWIESWQRTRHMVDSVLEAG